MPFKLQRYGLNCGKFFTLFVFVLALGAHSAFAISVRRVLNFGIIEEDASTVYYMDNDATLTATDNFIDSPNGFYRITRNSEIGLFDTTASYIEMSFSADVDAPTESDKFLAVWATTSNGANTYAIPFAAVNGESCDTLTATTNCRVVAANSDPSDPNRVFSGTGRRAFATTYASGTSVKLRFFLKEMCKAFSGFSAGGPSGPSCDSSYIPTLTSGSALIPISFKVGPLNNTATSDSLGSAAATQTKTVNIRLQTNPPTLRSCTIKTSENFYFPGDGEIQILQPEKIVGVAGIGSSAPETVIAVTRIGGTSADLSVNYQQNNNSVTVGTRSAAFSVRGLINSTATQATNHSIGFFLRDAAGVVALPPSSGGTATDADCTLDNVRTAQVLGFLKDANCFIASGIHHNGHYWGVRALRYFRDQYLSKLSLGRQFISWYYSWSPQAAVKLQDYPALRAVLWVLITPLEAFAWTTQRLSGILGTTVALCITTFFTFGLLLTLFFWIARGVRWGNNRGFEKKRLLLTILILMPAILLYSGFALANPSPSPYMDDLKKELSETEPAEAPAGSFIRSKKKQLQEEEALEADQYDYDASYIEGLRKIDPELKAESKQKLSPYIDGIKSTQSSTETEKSAILSTRAGKDELDIKIDNNVKQAFSFRYSPFVDRAVTAAPANTAAPFTRIYGSSGIGLDFNFSYEYQFWRSESSFALGALVNAGLSYSAGKGRFQATLPNQGTSGLPGGPANFSETSNIRVQFFTVPITLGPVVRFNALHYVRPYIFGGPTLILFSERRSDEKAAINGYSTGASGAAGIAILLDWISRSSRASLYEAHTIKHYYLNLEYGTMVTLDGPVEFATDTFNVGFTFEM